MSDTRNQAQVIADELQKLERYADGSANWLSLAKKVTYWIANPHLIPKPEAPKLQGWRYCYFDETGKMLAQTESFDLTLAEIGVFSMLQMRVPPKEQWIANDPYLGFSGEARELLKKMRHVQGYRG